MLFASYVHVFPEIFAAIKNGGTPVLFFDQDRTLTVKTGVTEYQYDMTLHPDVIPAVEKIIYKGGIYVPSTARSLGELQEGYASIPYLPMSANDGFVISVPDAAEPIYFGDKFPNYRSLCSDVAAFVDGVENVAWKEMGAYFQLMVDQDHPFRAECEVFFDKQLALVVARSKGLPMVIHKQPDVLSMEPRDNRSKAGAIALLLPKFNVVNPILIVAGDGRNDVPALKYAKENGGHAIWVHKGELQGVPEYATSQVANANDCVGLLKAIAEAM